MISRLYRLLLVMCLHGVVGGVAAQEPYLAAGLGSSSWNFVDCGATGCDRTTNSWRVAAGYRFNRIVALEGFYSDYGCARTSSASLDGELCGTALGVQALLGYQFGAVDFAGKIGLAGVRSELRPSLTSFDVATVSRNTELSAGMMGAYRFTPNLALRLDVDIVTVALNSTGLFYSRGADVTTAMLGLMVRY
jgi:hypothetical protein